MPQILHLLIVDAARGLALVATFGGRWLLPVLTCGERVRADRYALRWVTSRGFEADVVGQWLGRVGRAGTDWLIVLTVTFDHLDPQLSWTPLGELRSATAVVEYQAWAVAKSLDDSALPSVPGPFGRVGWHAEVKAWIERVSGGSCACFVPYRAGAHEVVLGAQGVSGPVYFKGLFAERNAEARLTRLMSDLDPSLFARTIALEPCVDGTAWWLTAGCPGRPAVEGQVVVRALARVQRRVLSSEPVRRALPTLDLPAAFAWARDLVGEGYRDALASCLQVVTTPGVPRSWIPMDLDPVNVLAEENGALHFIDLDDSFFGPAALAMALFASRSRHQSSYGVYEQSWFPVMSGIDWPGFERAVAVLDAWLGWRRVVRNTARGDLYGALEPAEARIRERLVRILHRR